MGEDSARAAELIERTLYAMEAQSLITLWEEKFCKQNFLHTQYSYSRSQMLTIWTYFTLHGIWCDFRSFGKIYSSVIIQLVWGGVPRFWLWSKMFRHKAYKKMRWIISLGLLKKRSQQHQFVHLTSFFAALNQISSNLSLGCPEII